MTLSLSQLRRRSLSEKRSSDAPSLSLSLLASQSCSPLFLFSSSSSSSSSIHLTNPFQFFLFLTNTYSNIFFVLDLFTQCCQILSIRISENLIAIMELTEITSKLDRSCHHVSFHDERRTQGVTIQDDPSSMASGHGTSSIKDSDVKNRAGKCQEK